MIRKARMNGAELERYWQHRKGLLLSQDKQLGLITSSLALAVLCYNVSILYRGQLDGGTAVFRGMAALANPLAGCMLLHLAFELVLYTCIYQVQLYVRYRTHCVMAIRLVALSFMLLYVPKTWETTVPLELAYGKHAALTYRLVMGGCLTASGTFEALAFQLPIVVAIPYHVARALLCLVATLPQLLHVFAANPLLHGVAKLMWEDISWLYGSAAMSAMGADVPINTSTAPCTVLALMLYVHITIAVLVPLYILALVEGRSKERFFLHLQSQSGSSSSSSGSSGRQAAAITVLQQQQQQQHSPDAAAVAGSNSAQPSSSTASTTSANSTGSAGSSSRANSRSDSFTSGVVAVSGAAGGQDLNAVDIRFGLGVHALILFCCSMLLWALLDAAVTLWGEQGAGSMGMCV